MQTTGGPNTSPEHVREVLEQVLSGVEFREETNPLMGAVSDFFEWFFSLFEDLGFKPSRGALELGIELVWIALLVLATALLMAILIRHVRAVRARPARKTLTLTDEVAQSVSRLRQEAAQAERAGDFTLALRLHFFALVVGLGQRGELEYNAAWTNRELLERGQPQAEVAQLLRPLVGELDAHSFGDEPTYPSQVQRFALACERLLGGQVA